MDKGKLYLIPVPISEGENNQFFPEANASIVEELELFFVENTRSARRAIRKLCPNKSIDTLTFVEIGKHANENEFNEFIQKLHSGTSAGILSEAGCPGVADPGANIVRLAHQAEIRVIPLIGPSSILLGLMASGLNGQKFSFQGYLPRESGELKQVLKQLDQRIQRFAEAQIFIETPYRNQKIFDTLLSQCSPSTKLCIAQDITGTNERIITKSITSWRKKPFSFEKLPTLFILGV